MNATVNTCDVKKNDELGILIDNYKRGDFKLLKCDYLMQNLNIDSVYPYFKSIEIAEALDSNGNFTLDALITRNMLSSRTKIAVTGMQDIMQSLDNHWNLVSNCAFMYVLEKDRKLKGEECISQFTIEGLDNFITLFSFNAIFVNTIRMTLILLDDIVKYIDEENPDKSRRYGKEILEKRLASNKFAMVEIKNTWDKIQDTSVKVEYQNFIRLFLGGRRTLNETVDRLLSPIEKVIAENKVITKVVNDDNTENKFFSSVYDFAEELVAMMRDYQKAVLFRDEDDER